MAAKLMIIGFRGIALSVLLIAICQPENSNKFRVQLSTEGLQGKFSNFTLMRPSDPPQYFNATLKRWEPEHWPLDRIPEDVRTGALPPFILKTEKNK
jgi:hypothetical protein